MKAELVREPVKVDSESNFEANNKSDFFHSSCGYLRVDWKQSRIQQYLSLDLSFETLQSVR